MFFFLSKLLDIALSPLTWAMGLCLFGIAPSRRKKSPRLAHAAPVLAVLVLYVFSIEPVSNALWRSLEVPPVKTMKDGVTYDAVILLGGVVEGREAWSSGQRSYNDNVERLLEVFDLLRTGKAKNVIITGGPSYPGIDVGEAPVLGKQLEDWGIAHDRITLEDRARNTRENAVESSRLAREHGWQTLLVVTSAFHMERALECFNAVGLEVDTFPVDFRTYETDLWTSSWLPRTGSLDESTGAIREHVGRVVYRAKGYATKTRM